MRKLVEFLILFSTVTTMMGCSNYKYLYGYATEDSYKRVSKSLEYVLKKEEMFLVFTKNYDDSKIKVIQNDAILFEENISNNKNGMSKVFIINKNSEVIVEFEGIKKPLNITVEQMKLYKHIYLENNKNKIAVEFNDYHKDSGGIMPANQ